MRRRILAALLVMMFVIDAPGQQKISEDRDLLELDLSNWDCRDRPEGSAKTPDGVERNREKNRSAVDLTGVAIREFDTASFLAHVADFDAATKGKRRKDLT